MHELIKMQPFLVDVTVRFNIAITVSVRPAAKWYSGRVCLLVLRIGGFGRIPDPRGE
jgi:hypothetical protein